VVVSVGMAGFASSVGLFENAPFVFGREFAASGLFQNLRIGPLGRGGFNAGSIWHGICFRGSPRKDMGIRRRGRDVGLSASLPRPLGIPEEEKHLDKSGDISDSRRSRPVWDSLDEGVLLRIAVEKRLVGRGWAMTFCLFGE